MDKPTLPWRTERETRECLQDRGHRIAAAQAYHYIGKRIEGDDSYPLPPDAEAVIALAAEAMQAYAAARMAAIKAAAAETHAAITGRSAA